MQVFRRYSTLQKMNIKNAQPIIIHNLRMLPDCRKIYYKEKQIFFTGTEYDVLERLAKQPGRVFTKAQILQTAGSEDPQDEDNAVRCLIAGIRKKLRKYTNKEYIQTVRGVGYRFEIA